jgi:hypothetical protein
MKRSGMVYLNSIINSLRFFSGRISDPLFQHGSRHGKDLLASRLSAKAVQISIKKRIDKHVVLIAEQVLIALKNSNLILTCLKRCMFILGLRSVLMNGVFLRLNGSK